MKRSALALTLIGFVSTHSIAAESNISKFSVGGGFSFGDIGFLSFHGDYQTSNEDVKVRINFDYRVDDGADYTASISVLTIGGYYDFNRTLGLDEKISPYLGLGYGRANFSFECDGGGDSCGLSPFDIGGSGFAIIAGVRYSLNERFALEASINGAEELSLGVHYSFR